MKTDESQAPRSSTKKPSSSSVLPSGFKLIGSSKESHGREIYCVSWSKNFFVEEVVSASSTDDDDDDDDNDDENDTSANTSSAFENPTTLDNNTTMPVQQRRQKQRKLRCFATCAGNQVTIYEVEIGDASSISGKPATTAGHHQHQSKQDAGLIVRQGYIDPDDSETFYSCAFGGNCLGKPFNYRPMSTRKTASNEPIILEGHDETSTSRKRARISEDTTSVDKTDGLAVDMSSDGAAHIKSGMVPSYASLLDAKTFDGPQLLCVAGTRGIIKVIDPVRKMLFSTLSGHGDDIYDLKFSPVDEWLLLSASKDESLRLWNVQTTTCIAIFAGHEGHRDCVLSCGWHRSGDRFASGGMDTTVKLWEMSGQLETVVRQSRAVKPTLWNSATNPNPNFTTLYEQMPYFSTTKVHTNYVDCVQFVGDLILSKDTNNSIFLWLPKREKSKGTKQQQQQQSATIAQQRLPNEMIALREFPLDRCGVWFIRFHTDLDCRMLAIGNTLGEIQIFELDDHPTKKHQLSLVHQYCTSCVRMVAFSPDNEFLVATRDDSSVWMWEAYKD